VKSRERVLRCDCGFEARAEHEDELVAEVQRHAWEAHAIALAPDEARSLAFRADVLQREFAQANPKARERHRHSPIDSEEETMRRKERRKP
jgi:hypothetical protein